MKSRKSIKKNKPEARNLYVSESMLVECFDSVLYPVVLTKGSEILHQNLSAKMNKSLVTTLEDLLKKNADIEWITDENGGCWNVFKLASQRDTEVFMFTECKKKDSKDEFYEQLIRQLAHEFRTPLNSILGFTEIMLEETDDEALRDYLMTILKAGESLVSMLSQVLDYGSIAAGKFSVESSPVEMRTFVELLSFFFLPQARHSNLDFIVTVPENLPQVLVFDAGRVRQILFNLISNALKYTTKGSVRVELKIDKIENENVYLVWEVRDTGSGLPPQFYEKGIGEYERGAKGRALAESAGLGLAIALRMAQALNGELTFSQIPGEGTSFVFRMKAQIQRLEEKEFTGTSTLLAGYRVLIVDELSVTRNRLKYWIEQAGGKAREASSISQAMELVGCTPFHALIVALNPLQLETLRETLIRLKRPPLSEVKPSVAILPYGENRREIMQNFDLVMYQPISCESFIDKLASSMGPGNLPEEISSTSLSKVIKGFQSSAKEDLKNLIDKYLPSVPGLHDLEKERQFADKLIHWALRQKSDIFINFGKKLLVHLNRFELDEFESLMYQLNEIVNYQTNQNSS